MKGCIRQFKKQFKDQFELFIPDRKSIADTVRESLNHEKGWAYINSYGRSSQEQHSLKEALCFSLLDSEPEQTGLDLKDFRISARGLSFMSGKGRVIVGYVPRIRELAEEYSLISGRTENQVLEESGSIRQLFLNRYAPRDAKRSSKDILASPKDVRAGVFELSSSKDLGLLLDHLKTSLPSIGLDSQCALLFTEAGAYRFSEGKAAFVEYSPEAALEVQRHVSGFRRANTDLYSRRLGLSEFSKQLGSIVDDEVTRYIKALPDRDLDPLSLAARSVREKHGAEINIQGWDAAKRGYMPNITVPEISSIDKTLERINGKSWNLVKEIYKGIYWQSRGQKIVSFDGSLYSARRIASQEMYQVLYHGTTYLHDLPGSLPIRMPLLPHEFCLLRHGNKIYMDFIITKLANSVWNNLPAAKIGKYLEVFKKHGGLAYKGPVRATEETLLIRGKIDFIKSFSDYNRNIPLEGYRQAFMDSLVLNP